MTFVANELFDAVSNERIEAAVDRTLRRHRGGTPPGPLAWFAAEATFCTFVTGVEDAIAHHLSAVHAALAANVVQLSERRQDTPSWMM